MLDDSRLAAWRARAEQTLQAALPDPAQPPRRLHAAMRHAALLGGKRLRPMLVYATGSALGADEVQLDAAAAAVELVHAYSLVHDDLPAMDDDALRRGQPTVHVAFDEATAILAGDALQSLAFELLANAPLPADTCVRMLRELASAAGAAGMCGGQALDIDATGQAARIQIDALEHLHALKTGALIRASVRLGAIAGNADESTFSALDRFAQDLGLAFQIRDDMLDVEGDSTTLGKTPGKDAQQSKATFVSLAGLDGARTRLQQLAQRMTETLQSLGPQAHMLQTLAASVIERDR